ncbi:MAG: chemotaxis protein CheB, partial [Alphaproteobacteria bacterium]
MSGGQDKHDDAARPVAIAVVGASAGGLAALRAMFAAMPPDSGVAFVVVQHRSPGNEALLVDLLAGSTSLPVVPGSDGAALLPDRVLVAPAGMVSSFGDGVLHVGQPVAPGQPADLPIDHALRSLAEEAGQRAIAVILSGHGSDGAYGLRAVKEAGGIALVQSPSTAEAAGMPGAAIASGAV